jgi:hypothetical protein
MTTTLEESNAALRAAVRERLDATPADDHKVAGSPISGGAYVNIVTGEPLRHPSLPLTEPRHIAASAEESPTGDHWVAPPAECLQHVELGYDAATMKAAAEHIVASAEETQRDESDVPYVEYLLGRQRGDSVLSETYAEWEPGFQPVTPAEQTLRDAIATIRDRHGKYGPPTEHFTRTASLVNAAFGTTFTPADWALVMVLDKIARQLGTGQATDDAAIDIAGYAACHQECRRA